MIYYVHDPVEFSIYATYSSEAKALRALKNAIEKNWKLGGRKYMQRTLERLSVVSSEEFEAADVMVETFNCLNPEAGPVMIRRSQKGNPVYDPACDGYHSM